MLTILNPIINIFDSIVKHIADFLSKRFSVFLLCTIMFSFSLIFLIALLFPWENLTQMLDEILPESLMSLGAICFLSTTISLALSMISIIRLWRTLRKEKERFDIAISYIKVLNDIERDNIYVDEGLKRLMPDEYLTRKECAALKDLAKLSNCGNTYNQEEINVDDIIDSAKTAVEKVSDIAG